MLRETVLIPWANAMYSSIQRVTYHGQQQDLLTVVGCGRFPRVGGNVEVYENTDSLSLFSEIGFAPDTFGFGGESIRD